MYYAISKAGSVYSGARIEDLPIENILCYLKRIEESKQPHTSPISKNKHWWYRYEFVNQIGDQSRFSIGSCKVIFISQDIGYSYLCKRVFTIEDQYGREGHFAISGERGATDELFFEKIATHLVPFMLKLSNIGGWDAYKFAIGNTSSLPICVFDQEIGR